MRRLFLLTMKKNIKKEVLRIGRWFHPNAPKGVLDITAEKLNEIVANFQVSPFVPVFRGHVDNTEAEKDTNLIISKNVKSLSTDGKKLFAEFEADEKELEKYNDVSARIDPVYVNKETGKSVGAVLSHIAMVLNPYIKGMGDFTMLSENDKNYLINLSEIQSMADKQDPITPEVELEEAKVEETEVESKEAEVEQVTTEEVEPEVTEESKEEVAETPEAVETSAEEVTSEAEVAEVVTEVVEEVPAKDSEKTEVEASEDAVSQIKQLQEQLAQARLELSSREAEDKYKVLLSEGRILPSQKEAFIALHENVKGTIDLADKKQVNLTDLLVTMFHRNPVLVNLEESGVNEVNAEVSEDETVIADFRKLPVHAGKTDEEWAAFVDKNRKTILEDSKESKEK